jgi:hypothetical protein
MPLRRSQRVWAGQLAAGCGSSDSSSSGTSGAGTRAPTATATTPAPPPGASARACGGTVAGIGQLRVTGVSCGAGRGIAAAWASKRSCAAAEDASRSSCAVPGGYRCLGASAGRGLAVSCARPGASVAFLARPG